MKYYVAYGSNLNMDQMANRCPDAKIVGRGTIKNYKLAFWGVATILPSEGDEVPVGVWQVNDRDERALDRYEGWPHLYRKEWVDVEMYDGTVKECMVYIMNYGKGSVPSRYYYNTIYQGYKDVGLNVRYLSKALAESFDAEEAG